MKTQHERLRWARKQAGYKTVADFARSHGIEVGTYRHHENGIRGLRPPVARRYARLLGINFNWLLTGEGQPKADVALSPDNKPLLWVPVVSWVVAGQVTEQLPYLDETTQRVPVVWQRDTLFALRVRGTSMNNVAEPGDVIVVDYGDRQPQDRKIYLIECRGEISFKRYRDTGGPVRFEPDSSERGHDPIFPDGDFRIIGRVILVQKSI